MILKQTDTFIEVEISLPDGTQIGTAEVNPGTKQLEWFNIWEPYQNKGYGQEALADLIEEYDLKTLWVRSDNERAIHVYEKAGFARGKETMFEMVRGENNA